MKKILIAVVLILFGVAASAQLQQQSLGGSATTLSTTQGGLMGKLYFVLPKKDTLNNAATMYPGALTVRPQDTLITLYPPIYMSNGHFWISVGSGANGIDSITVSPDSTLYRAYNKGNQIFTFSTLLRNVKAGTNVTFTWDVDTLVINSGGGSAVTDSTQWAVSDSLSTPAVTPREGTKFLVGLFATGAFSGHENQIATYDSVPAIYSFQSADLGDLLYNANNGVVSVWTGAAWVWVGKLIIHHPNDNYGFALSLGTLGAFPVAIRTTNTPRITIGANGDITFNSYTSGHTGTPTGSLQVDATGKVIIGATSGGSGWLLTGNTGTDQSTNFIGTTDGQGLTFKVNGGFSGRLEQGFSANTSLGYLSFLANTTGENNVSYGVQSLKSNTEGTGNTSLGAYSLWLNTTGYSNTGVGSGSVGRNTTGINNTGVGTNSIGFINGNDNIGLGVLAGGSATTGSKNIYIGDTTISSGDAGGSENEIVIGHAAEGHGSNSMTLGNINNTGTYLNGYTGTNNVATPSYSLGIDSATGKIVKFTAGGGTVTASNGLTKVVDDIQLGGTTTANTTIDIDTHNFTINSAGSTSFNVSDGNGRVRGTTSLGKSMEVNDDGDYSLLKYDDNNKLLINSTGTNITGNVSATGQIVAQNSIYTSPPADESVFAGAVNSAGSLILNIDATTGRPHINFSIGDGSANSELAQDNVTAARVFQFPDVSGSLTVSSASTVGIATLSGGTVTVSSALALTASKIFVTVKTPSGTRGFLAVPTITNGVSFVISSTSATETSTVNWWIVN